MPNLGASATRLSVYFAAGLWEVTAVGQDFLIGSNPELVRPWAGWRIQSEPGRGIARRAHEPVDLVLTLGRCGRNFRRDRDRSGSPRLGSNCVSLLLDNRAKRDLGSLGPTIYARDRAGSAR